MSNLPIPSLPEETAISAVAQPAAPPKNKAASALLGAIVPKDFNDALKMAAVLSHSTLVPKGYQAKEQKRETAGDIVVAGMWGAELGFSWVQSLKAIAVINGTASIWGTAGYAIMLASGDLEVFEREWDAEKKIATVTIKRRGFPQHVGRFSLEDAKRAGLAGKNTYIAYPDVMCLWRAFWRAAHPSYADKFMGLEGAEDSMDRTAPVQRIVEPKALPAAPSNADALGALFSSDRPALAPAPAPAPDLPREQVSIKTVAEKQDSNGKVWWLPLSEDKAKRKVWTRSEEHKKIADEAVASAWPVLISLKQSVKDTWELVSISLAPNPDTGGESAPPETDEAPGADAEPQGDA